MTIADIIRGFDKSHIFFTSDTHYHHLNYVRGTSTWQDKSKCRDFDTVEQHDSTIISNINSMVGANDLLFHLGDLALGHHSNVRKFCDALVCKNIILLRGNHASHIDDYADCFLGIYDYLEFVINKQFFVACHFPIASWREMSRNSIHLHGHTHGDFENGGKSMDVGLDTNGFFPYTYGQIISLMNSKPVVARGHH